MVLGPVIDIHAQIFDINDFNIMFSFPDILLRMPTTIESPHKFVFQEC